MIFEIFTLTAVILIIYAKTYKYKLLIDDEVPREGYLVTLTTDEGIRPKPEFYQQTRSFMYTFTSLGIFYLCVFLIYIMYGFWASLLFAVMPLNVCGVAWATGSYYMTTTFFILTTQYFATHLGVLGKILSFIFYWISLETTVSAFPYPFFAILTQGAWGGIYLIPLFLFLFGKRFQTGVKKRKDLHKGLNVESGQIDLRRIFIVPKVIAYYIALTIFPSRLGFFHDAQRFLNVKSPDRIFYGSLTVIALFTYFGWGINKEMTLFYLLNIALYSQYTTLGMFIAERYTLVANLSMCVILGAFLPHSFAICLATLWAYRSFMYVKAYRNNEQLFSESCRAFPHTAENFNNLAAYYMEWGRYELALANLLASLRLDHFPTANTLINTSICYEQLGQFGEALIYIDKALKICGDKDRGNLESRRVHLLNKIVVIDKQRKEINKILSRR